MNTEDILNKIQVELNDPAILRTRILDTLNDVMLFVASEARLPELFERDHPMMLVAEDTYVNMPGDYLHSLVRVYSTTNTKLVPIQSNSYYLYKDYDTDTTGELEAVAVEGSIMYLRPELSADEEIVIDYYTSPTTLSDSSTSVPSSIPDDLRLPLLVDGTTMRLAPQASFEGVRKSLNRYSASFSMGFNLLKKRYSKMPTTRIKRVRKIQEF